MNNTKRTFYITDLIGSYCGMHYYDKTFAELLRKKNCEVKILSNFSENGEKAFFPTIFHRNKILSILLLLKSFILLVRHMMNHRQSTYIYMCYGELYDLLMMLPNIYNKQIYCDVHEVHALKYADNSKISFFFNWYYTRVVQNFIYHSERTKNILHSMGVKAPMLYVPHFKYTFKKSYNHKLLESNLSKIFQSDKKKFLFFGNLSTVKGIDIVINTFSNLPDCWKNKIELVIAGKNVDNIDFSSLKAISTNFHIIDRHINDDELVYLYQHTDYILLPYKKSSQSGIFAMAAYFHKPMILSDIPYFKKMIMDFPSFGIISSLNNYEDTIINLLDKDLENSYLPDDCNRFEMKKEINDFINQLISKNNKKKK